MGKNASQWTEPPGPLGPGRLGAGVDRATFEKLAIEHLDAVHRMAMQLTKRPEAAADLVQETYLKALRASVDFEERGKGMRAWLFTILHNTFYSDLRKAQRSPSAVGEFFEASDTEVAPDEAPPAWDLASLDWEHVDDRLKRAIEDLSPEHREILLLWGVEGLKYREIGEILGVPLGTVMSRLHRARKVLVESLEEFAAELGWS